MPFSCIPFFACNRQIDVLDRRQCNLQSVPNDIDRNARTLEEAYLDCNHIKDLEKVIVSFFYHLNGDISQGTKVKLG
uniref:Uncharacterized protein n=1 Tax=Parascaris equorum TaxID=6256 RepID=A0A914RA23_PAREQ